MDWGTRGYHVDRAGAARFQGEVSLTGSAAYAAMVSTDATAAAAGAAPVVNFMSIFRLTDASSTCCCSEEIGHRLLE